MQNGEKSKEEQLNELMATLLNSIKETLPSVATSLRESIPIIQGLIDNKNSLASLLNTAMGDDPNIADIVQHVEDLKDVETDVMEKLAHTSDFLGTLEDFFNGTNFAPKATKSSSI